MGNLYAKKSLETKLKGGLFMGDKKQPEANLKGTFFFVMGVGIFIVAAWALILNLYLDRF